MAAGPPETTEPGKEYLGVICRNCQRFFSVVGPLDPAEVPPDRPMRIGARGPLSLACPHCGDHADYPVGNLIRGRITEC